MLETILTLGRMSTIVSCSCFDILTLPPELNKTGSYEKELITLRAEALINNIVFIDI